MSGNWTDQLPPKLEYKSIGFPQCTPQFRTPFNHLTASNSSNEIPITCSICSLFWYVMCPTILLTSSSLKQCLTKKTPLSSRLLRPLHPPLRILPGFIPRLLLQWRSPNRRLPWSTYQDQHHLATRLHFEYSHTLCSRHGAHMPDNDLGSGFGSLPGGV